MSISHLLITGLLSVVPSSNNPSSTNLNENYITSTNNHCKVSNPNPQENETITWSGKCVNGFASGQGTVQWYENGEKSEVFTGVFRHGKRHHGKVTWKSGSVYQGGWLNDYPHGYGKLTLPKSEKTIEGIKHWKQHGKGHWQGDIYVIQGIFKKGKLKIECSSIKECKKQQTQ